MLKQVTTLTNAAPATILTPGPSCHWYSIQNIGAAAVNLSFDGGSTYTATNGKKGTDPTTTATGLGFALAAGATITIQLFAGGNSLRLPVVGILQTVTGTTLNITTDDTNSS